MTRTVSSRASALATATALAGLAGLRSMLPLALISRRLVQTGIRPTGVLAPLGRPAIARSLTVAALGEVLADKTRFIPARIDPLPLAGRVIAGATVAVAVATSRGFVHRANGAAPPDQGGAWGGVWLAALAGATAALASSFASYQLRRSSTRSLHLPDPVAAVAEDALCFVAARRLVEHLSR